MSHCEGAVVESVQAGPEDHGILTFYLFMKLDGGGTQGFGGMVLDERTLPIAKEELRVFFDAVTFDDIVGRRCHTLRCFDGWNETIEGLETHGRRWTLTSFRQRHYDAKDTVLERRIASLHDDIRRHNESIVRANERLRTVRERYRDWEKP